MDSLSPKFQNVSNIIKGYCRRIFPSIKKYKKSYAQSGEDIIISFIFDLIGIRSPRHLDIGGHDPVYLNNTYFFYIKGCTGVNIEPDPFLFEKFIRKRRRDVNLNIGAAAEACARDFYIMTERTLNTFSVEEAKRYESYGKTKIEKVLKINVLNVNDVMREYFHPKPNFVSLDVEGLELEILKSFDFKNYRPEVFCIETITYTEDKSEKKLNEIINFMCSKGYFVYADTYINTIFVEKKAWADR